MLFFAVVGVARLGRSSYNGVARCVRSRSLPCMTVTYCTGFGAGAGPPSPAAAASRGLPNLPEAASGVLLTRAAAATNAAAVAANAAAEVSATGSPNLPVVCGGRQAQKGAPVSAPQLACRLRWSARCAGQAQKGRAVKLALPKPRKGEP